MCRSSAIQLLHAAVPLLGVTALLSGCGRQCIVGRGPRRTIQPNVTQFESVLIDSGLIADIKVGDTIDVSIDVYDNLAKFLRVQVVEGTLKLYMTDGVCEGFTPTKATITVPRPLLDAHLFGNGAMTVDEVRRSVVATHGFMKVERLDPTNRVTVDLSGSGSLRILGGNSANVVITHAGSGVVTLDSLTTTTAEIKLSGSGSLTGMTSQICTIDSTGSGSITTTVTESVDGACSDSGKVTIHGGATKRGTCFSSESTQIV